LFDIGLKNIEVEKVVILTLAELTEDLIDL